MHGIDLVGQGLVKTGDAVVDGVSAVGHGVATG